MSEGWAEKAVKDTGGMAKVMVSGFVGLRVGIPSSTTMSRFSPSVKSKRSRLPPRS
jgi:hypothetical protein